MADRDPAFLWETEALRRSREVPPGDVSSPGVESSAGSEQSAAPEPGPEADPGEGRPPGTMLIPISAWERMLGQLGNLHEAGQQLAEARERAARAETEAQFLKERLAELRRQLEEAGGSVEDPPQPPPPEDPPSEPAASASGSAVRRIRRRLSRMIW